jgi:hypothetical protein
VSIQDRLLDSLRRCCQGLPDRRQGRNTSYAMADFALGAFAPFFTQSACFLAHQRHLETGHGGSNCKTLFGMCKIPGDSQIRAKLDAVEPAMFHPIACPCKGARACAHVMWPTERLDHRCIFRLPDAT